jgi:uncharacterized short protein YbdD (DUF466 family)
LLQKGWNFLRRLSGDDAYERYLEHCRAAHDDNACPLDRETFHRRETERKWNGVKRCC